MSNPKRNVENQSKKNIKISLRTNHVLIDELKQKSGKQDTTKAIEEAIKEYLEFKRDTSTNYVCDECNKTIKKQEPYFCNLNQLEIRTNNEIVVTKGEPQKILCMKCAKKDSKILEFIESEEADEEGNQVVESSRILND